MLLSKMTAHMLKTRKDFRNLKDMPISQYLQELSFFDKDAAGGTVKLPLEAAVERKVKADLARKVDGAQISLMDFPILQDADLWKLSKRFDKFDGEFVYSKEGSLLYPTSEEPTVGYFSQCKNISYKDLPITLAGFRKLFRNCTSKNIVRLSEFEILDMYSIDAGPDSIKETIRTTIAPLFDSVWKQWNLNVVPVPKREGYTDFKYITEEGDDKIPGKEDSKCLSVGVIMDLADFYSRSMDLTYFGPTGEKQYPSVGSYALGIERIFYSMAHQNKKEVNGNMTIAWPNGTAPFEVGVIGIGENGYDKRTQEHLISKGIPVLNDDTKDSLGVKTRRLYAIGVPYIAFAGEREEKKGVLGIEETRTGQRYERKIDDLVAVARKVI